MVRFAIDARGTPGHDDDAGLRNLLRAVPHRLQALPARLAGAAKAGAVRVQQLRISLQVQPLRRPAAEHGAQPLRIARAISVHPQRGWRRCPAVSGPVPAHDLHACVGCKARVAEPRRRVLFPPGGCARVPSPRVSHAPHSTHCPAPPSGWAGQCRDSVGGLNPQPEFP